MFLSHIAQMCSGWIINNPVNEQLRAGIAQVLEQASPSSEQYGHQSDLQLVNDA